jgi:4-alpha-glucanotransferase
VQSFALLLHLFNLTTSGNVERDCVFLQSEKITINSNQKMDIFFNIDYKTTFGEELLLNVIKHDDSEHQQLSTLRMKTHDGTCWQCRLHIDNDTKCDYIDYYYSVDCEKTSQRHEWIVVPHRAELGNAKTKKMTIYDKWIDTPEDGYLYSSAFTECLNRHYPVQHIHGTSARTVTLKVRAPQLRATQRLALTGSNNALGDWSVNKAILMTEHSVNEWIVNVDASTFEHGKDEKPIEFKFVVFNEKTVTTGNTLQGFVPNIEPTSALWETADNRTLTPLMLQAGEEAVYDLGQAFFAIYNTKVAGTLVPLFSLRTKGSFGVGDIGDLKAMTDYISATHQRVLQLLPINDTIQTRTWTDSYPYSCISIFAIHPMYIDLRQLPEIKDENDRKRMTMLQNELNSLDNIDYERVNNGKEEYMHIIFEQEGKSIMATSGYKKFIKDNDSWLIPYSIYCSLRDKYGTADFTLWPENNSWDEGLRKQLSDRHEQMHGNLGFYIFMQYILDVQMSKAHEYARSKGVILKGDIPIGVSRYGCDVWTEPRYFNLDSQAGAPPDAFSTNGQNWGFPTYNWDEMLADDCKWWKRRFKHMAKYFDAYRIDHVLGFFRIWDIPLHSIQGLLGQFSPALGLTKQEIEAYGLIFKENIYTKPFIADWVIERVFGPHANYVRDKFLNHVHDDIYDIKTEYKTQRKIEAAFKSRTSDADKWIRDGLYSLISDVLFIRDRKDANKFHPRITAQFNFAYEALWDSDKNIFNRIYDDYYYHRNNQFWYREAMKKLPKLVQSTRMLVCAEDLGMVPDCVPWVMDELRILSLEIQSMPKDSKVRFGHLSRNPYRSVCTISTHDMPTLRQWWDEDENRTQDYYNNMLYREGPAPHPLPGWLARDIVSRNLTSPSMLCILSIQDWMATDEKLRCKNKDDERINIPSNPHHYWRYRMHINIEDIMANDEFMNSIKDLIDQSGRKI